MVDDIDLDGTAEGQDEVHATSISRMTSEFDRNKTRQKAQSKQAWKTKPIRAFFSKVALPSGLLGAAAYGLSYAHGAPNVELATISGAAWYPIHSVRVPVSRFMGKVDGAIRNLSSTFNKNTPETYFQQKTQEIRYEGWSDGAVTVLLATGAVLMPTYAELVADGGTAVYNGVSYGINIISDGIKAQNIPSPK